jgi:hypothetical protein
MDELADQTPGPQGQEEAACPLVPSSGRTGKAQSNPGSVH